MANWFWFCPAMAHEYREVVTYLFDINCENDQHMVSNSQILQVWYST